MVGYGITSSRRGRFLADSVAGNGGNSRRFHILGVPPVLFCGMSGGGNVKQAGFSFGLSKEV